MIKYICDICGDEIEKNKTQGILTYVSYRFEGKGAIAEKKELLLCGGCTSVAEQALMKEEKSIRKSRENPLKI